MQGNVLDPTVQIKDDIADPGATLDSLAGKMVGIRVDILWRSWDWVSEEWAEELTKAGATVKFWRPAGRSGQDGERALVDMKAFWRSVDVAVVGLANCGSCTGWTIHDALAAVDAGLPTVAIATRHFEDLAHALAMRGGRSGLRVQVLPYPLDILPKEQVYDIARDHYRPLLRTLGMPDRLVDEQAA
jgi:hypothetical protein